MDGDPNCVPSPDHGHPWLGATATGGVIAFDEEKCRNVLVRYCAHIPRNYQYRDGIRLVFLVLRDHLGDEQLGNAGGVLYELIEVDCQHTDDKGAAFQRWRHDHMNRHVNLELPHIPHLTTIASAIVPTAKLAEWRNAHPQRYFTRLHDSASLSQQGTGHKGCVRTHKSWMIDYTMYVSSRDGGTRPFRGMDPKEFHERQWGSNIGNHGRIEDHKVLDLNNAVLSSENDGRISRSLDTAANQRHESFSTKRQSDIFHLVKKVSLRRRTAGSLVETPSNPNCPSPEMPALFPTQPVDEWIIPNGVFARKFGIFGDESTLPPSIRELPVAEDKVMNTAVNTSIDDFRCSRGVNGPFTPQLWFDSGLDYRWRRQRNGAG